MPATPLTTPTEALNPFKVLVVDDHDDNRDILRILLKRHHVEVLEATDGIEAIKMACLKLPDLILMDISMPVMDGLESVRQLKGVELTKSIPVVIISAHCGDPNINKKALDVGCLQCIKKPFDLQEIVSLVQKLQAQTANT